MSSKSLWSIESKDRELLPAEAVSTIQEKFGDDMDDSNFADTYGEDIKTAFLLGLGAVKCYWDKGMKFDSIEPENFFIDPAYKPSQYNPPKYVIERKKMDLGAFKRMAKAINKKAKKEVYDMDVINDIEDDFRDTQAKYDELERKGLSQHTEVDKKVEIYEYWGDIIDDDNETIEENKFVVMVNQKYIVRDQKNPFQHKRPPYVPTVPVIYPHRGVAGISLVEPIAPLQSEQRD